VRVVKGEAVHKSTKKRVEVFLVRPPLYLTREEKDLLDAKAVALGFAPPDFLDRGRKRQVRNSVLAELCRRTVLAVHLGVSRFPEPTRRAFDPRRPLAALAREKTVGGRFECLSCEKHSGRRRVKRSHATLASRKHSSTLAKLRQSRSREAKLRKALDDANWSLRLALSQLEDLREAGVPVLRVPGSKRKAA
jgi:hypothetical protein